MAFKQSKQVVANKSLPIPARHADSVHIVGEVLVYTGVANGDIVEMAGIPAGCIPTGVKLVTEDCDSATGMTIDCGLLTGNFGDSVNARTMGNEFFAASTVAQAGGIQSENKFQGMIVSPQTGDVGVGIKFVAIGTPIVGARLRLIVTVIAAPASV